MATDSSKIAVLFVCSGNICRSPTAEALFRHKVVRAGLEDRFLIDSAGTHGMHAGDPPDPRAVATAKRRAVRMDDLRARQVTMDDLNRFDHIFAMDKGHEAALNRLAADLPDPALISLFLTFGGQEGGLREVRDPYYHPDAVFEEVFDLIEAGAERILRRFKRDNGWA